MNQKEMYDLIEEHYRKNYRLIVAEDQAEAGTTERT